MTLTDGQRNVLRFMSWSWWAWAGTGVLFALLGAVQAWVAPDQDWLVQGLHMFTYLAISVTQLVMAVIVWNWRRLFKEYM